MNEFNSKLAFDFEFILELIAAFALTVSVSLFAVEFASTRAFVLTSIHAFQLTIHHAFVFAHMLSPFV